MRVISVITYVPSLERVSSYELGKKHTTSFLKKFDLGTHGPKGKGQSPSLTSE